VPEDWTHHHIIFSADYLRTHPDIFTREPRALHQVFRRWGRQLQPGGGVNLSNTSQNSSGRDWSVQLGAGTSFFGTSPAKYNTDPTAPPDCNNDFVVFGINANGATGGQSTMVAFNQLFRGSGATGLCPGGPNYIFAYNTSTITNGRVRTSPVLSLDGKKIAFIESSATGSALHVLQWGTTGNNGFSSTMSAFPGTFNNAVMISIPYTTANNNHSSPWVDYASDTLWVGADDGKLYKFTGVFKGTPTEVTTGGWPVTITGVFQQTGPVYDSTSGNLFIGDNRGNLHSVNAATPGAVKNLSVGVVGNLNPAILDAPIVDSYGNVFATTSDDGNGAVVVQASASTLLQLARVSIGGGSKLGTNVNLYDGNFDNNFYNSENTGHFVACGTGALTIAPFRYSLSFSGGLLQADPAPVQISTSTTARCGPLTEYFNPNIAGGTDYFFWGVTNTCVGAGGCIMELANASTVTTAASVGGTSSVIIDNDSTQAGCSNLYYASQGGALTTRLATKVTQNGLN
jgi:hypothetical protein